MDPTLHVHFQLMSSELKVLRGGRVIFGGKLAGSNLPVIVVERVLPLRWVGLGEVCVPLGSTCFISDRRRPGHGLSCVALVEGPAG